MDSEKHFLHFGHIYSAFYQLLFTSISCLKLVKSGLLGLGGGGAGGGGGGGEGYGAPPSPHIPTHMNSHFHQLHGHVCEVIEFAANLTNQTTYLNYVTTPVDQ